MGPSEGRDQREGGDLVVLLHSGRRLAAVLPDERGLDREMSAQGRRQAGLGIDAVVSLVGEALQVFRVLAELRRGREIMRVLGVQPGRRDAAAPLSGPLLVQLFIRF